jgi:hypothetical protein
MLRENSSGCLVPNAKESFEGFLRLISAMAGIMLAQRASKRTLMRRFSGKLIPKMKTCVN